MDDLRRRGGLRAGSVVGLIDTHALLQLRAGGTRRDRDHAGQPAQHRQCVVERDGGVMHGHRDFYERGGYGHWHGHFVHDSRRNYRRGEPAVCKER